LIVWMALDQYPRLDGACPKFHQSGKESVWGFPDLLISANILALLSRDSPISDMSVWYDMEVLFNYVEIY